MDVLRDTWDFIKDNRMSVFVATLLLAFVFVPQLQRLSRPTRQAAVIIIATAVTPMAVPTNTPTPPNGLPRAVGAFDAPGGTYIGAIEPGRAYKLVARSGGFWLQIEAEGSGLVWVKADELAGLPSVPDMATPVPLAVASQQPHVVVVTVVSGQPAPEEAAPQEASSPQTVPTQLPMSQFTVR